MNCCTRCLTEMGAFILSMMLLVVNLVDLSAGLLLLVSVLTGVWNSFASAVVAASFSMYLVVLVVIVSSFGVMRQPGRRCLTASGLTGCFALVFELAVASFLGIAGRKKFVEVADVDEHAQTGKTVYWVLGQHWLVAVFAARHIVRYLATVGLRSARDGIANNAAASALEEQTPLSERLLAREARREQREERRAYFNNKYFDGRTVDGEPQVDPQGDQRVSSRGAELPNYVLTHHRDSTSTESQIDWFS